MILSDIQATIEERLTTDAWLAEHDVPVVSENLGDVNAELTKALAERDICALIMTPGFNPTSDASKIIVGDASVVVQIIETPFTNRLRPNFTTAQNAAEYVAWLLNLHPLPNNIGMLVFAPPGITSTTRGNDMLLYNCNFKIKTNITNPIEED